MPSRSRGQNSTAGLEFYDSVSAETTLSLAPVTFYDDFIATSGLNYATNGAIWALKDTGNATEAILADTANGVVSLALTNTSEKQESGIYFGDQRCFVAGQGLIFEARVCVAVTPTDVAEAVWGLASDYAEGGDAVANSAWFKVDGSTSILCESDDGTTDDDDNDTGEVTATDTFNVYRIDASDAADVRFYIDGDRVCGDSTFTLSAATLLQPYFYVYKASGAGLGTVYVDYVRIWQERS